ncbi:MAG: type IV pilus twitching motility protein PilT, partial [Verrucomicrobiales bacterium]
YVAADGTRYRVNLHRYLGRLGAALRPIKSSVPTMEDLGLPAPILENWIARTSGMVLVTGATGTGKSTTVAAALQWINENHSRHVVTIEDPIEYIFSDQLSIFTQREVGADTESFQQGLRSSLRQSPDVIFLGEIRDAETAATALQAAETGHLVVSTLHSADIGDTLERITGLFPATERDSGLFILSQQLIGVISQQLLPGENDDLVLAVEHFQNEGATRNWIRSREFKQLADFSARGDSPNNAGFLASIVASVKAGRVSREVGERYCGNAVEYQRALRGISGGSVS